MVVGWFAIQAMAAVAWGNGLAIPEVTSCGHPDLTAPFREIASYETPNHKWRITCRSKRDAGGWPEHSLAVSLAKEFIGKPIYVTGRWCELLWNDRNDLIALTDWEGSNLAEVTIIDLNQPEMKRRLAEIVPSASQCLSKDELDGHIYWEAVNWEGPSTLEVRVFGHTDEAHGHEFLYRFRVDLESKTFALLEKQNGADSNAEELIWDEKERVREKRQGAPSLAAPTTSASDAPETRPIRISGIATLEVFPGRPNYESLKCGDEPEEAWILTTGNGEKNQRFQLVVFDLTKEKFATLRRCAGKKIVVEGMVWNVQTGLKWTPSVRQRIEGNKL